LWEFSDLQGFLPHLFLDFMVLMSIIIGPSHIPLKTIEIKLKS